MPLNDSVPSSAADVLERNAEDFDRFVVGTSNTFVNRLGVTKFTLNGINREAIQSTGWFSVDGSFAGGGTIEQYNQVLFDASTGAFYSWGGALPKVVPASSTVAGTGGEGADAWTNRGDAALRTELEAGSFNIAGVLVTPEIAGGDIQAALTSLGAGSVLNLIPNTVYTIDSTITMLDGQEIIGNGATIKRVNQAVTTTTTAVSTSSNTFDVSDTTGFSVGMSVSVAAAGVARADLVIGSTLSNNRVITDISGATITLSANPTINSASGATVFTSFASVQMASNCDISGVNFDGNSSNWTYSRWETVHEILAPSTEVNNLIQKNTFVNLPSEAILCGGSLDILLNSFDTLGGNPVHISGGQDVSIAFNKATNGNIDLDVGHQDGFVSFSNSNDNVNVVHNIADTHISGAGAINATDTNIKVEDNIFTDMYCFGVDGGVSCENVSVKNNLISGAGLDPSKKPSSPYYGGVIFIAQSGDGLEIEGNTVVNVAAGANNRSLVVSGTGSTNRPSIKDNDLNDDVLFAGIEFDCKGNKVVGDIVVGATSYAKITGNSQVCDGIGIRLNASGDYKNVDIKDNEITGGVYAVEIGTSATSYENVSVMSNRMDDQTTRAVSFESFANTLDNVRIESNNITTGASSSVSWNGIVCANDEVSIHKNDIFNGLAAESRIGINTAGESSASNLSISFNEVRGNWSHTIIPAASSGATIAYNIVDIDVSNQTGNTITGTVII